MDKINTANTDDRQSMQELISCFSPEVKSYQKSETIMEYSSGEPARMAILCQGTARLEMIDRAKDSYLLDLYEKNDVFGDLFTLPLPGLHYTVTAVRDCEVLYLDYKKLLSPCEKHSQGQLDVLDELFRMIARKMQQMAMHLNLLFQPTTREKLLGYLKFIHAQDPSKPEFVLPISLSNLAEYLHVDRASMMRTLQLMKRDGLIESKARRFRLLEAAAQSFPEGGQHQAIPTDSGRDSGGLFQLVCSILND